MTGDVDLAKIVVAPRFGVDQGLKKDGSRKIRAVDDCTVSGVNACTEPSVKLNVEGMWGQAWYDSSAFTRFTCRLRRGQPDTSRQAVV